MNKCCALLLFVGIFGAVAASQDVTTEAAINSDVTSTTTASSEGEGGMKYLTGNPDVPTCQRSNANLGECVKRQLETTIPRLKHGIPELNIPSLDPFILNRTTFQVKYGNVGGRLTIRNTKFIGLSDVKYKKVDFKWEGNKIVGHLQSLMPRIEIVGEYKGQLIFNEVTLRPRGRFNVTVLKANSDVTSTGVLYEKDNHKFLRLTDYNLNKVDIGDLKFNADGIFPDPALNDLVLEITNQSWKNIYKVLLPQTKQYWAPLVIQTINEALSVVPFDNFFQER